MGGGRFGGEPGGCSGGNDPRGRTGFAGRLGGTVWRRSFPRAVATGAVVAVWLAALIVPPMMLSRAREGWLQQWDRPEKQAQWDAFLRDMREQSGRDGPVQRKVPKSAEPPARVWLRDYFRLAVAAWWLFVGVLGGFFTLLVAGVLRGQDEAASGVMTGSGSLAENQPRRQHDHE